MLQSMDDGLNSFNMRNSRKLASFTCLYTNFDDRVPLNTFLIA